jgi:hypothetical protein
MLRTPSTGKLVWKLHGSLERQVSDQGTQWLSEFWKHLSQRLANESRISTAYHPETDRRSERNNESLIHYLRAYVNHLQNYWAQDYAGLLALKGFGQAESSAT